MVSEFKFYLIYPYRVLAFLSIGCFVLCIWLTAFYQDGRPVEGTWLLVFGWLGPLEGQFAWFANPVYLAALVYWAEGRPILSLILAWIAVGLAASFFFTKTVFVSLRDDTDFISSLSWGFYLWLTAMTLLALTLSHVVYAVNRRLVTF